MCENILLEVDWKNNRLKAMLCYCQNQSLSLMVKKKDKINLTSYHQIK